VIKSYTVSYVLKYSTTKCRSPKRAAFRVTSTLNVKTRFAQQRA